MGLWIVAMTSACQKNDALQNSPAAHDGGSRSLFAENRPPRVTDDELSRWLSWQRAAAALELHKDGGQSWRGTARAQARLLAESKLTEGQVDAIEDAAAAIMTELAIARFSGQNLHLPPDAGIEIDSVFASPAWLELQSRFGHATVDVMLARESELAAWWAMQLEGK
jgi:hypothetical protein